MISAYLKIAGIFIKVASTLTNCVAGKYYMVFQHQHNAKAVHTVLSQTLSAM